MSEVEQSVGESEHKTTDEDQTRRGSSDSDSDEESDSCDIAGESLTSSQTGNSGAHSSKIRRTGDVELDENEVQR
jgi:hypothetical protein